MVDWRHREVAALVAHLVAAVAAILDPAGIPGAGNGVDSVVAGLLLGFEPYVVEHVELGLGGEVRGIADPGRGEIALRLAGDVARIAAVGLLGQRVVDEEVDAKGLRNAERVQVGRRGVWKQGHVRLVDLLEAADRRTVEVDSILEVLGAERAHRDGEVLHDAGQVAEANVDELDALILDIGQQIVGSLEHLSSGEIGRATGHALWLRARWARKWTTCSALSTGVLDAEQQSWTKADHMLRPRLSRKPNGVAISIQLHKCFTHVTRRRSVSRSTWPCRSPWPGSLGHVADNAPDTASAGEAYPGQRLGLPREGRGSLASWRRADWRVDHRLGRVHGDRRWFLRHRGAHRRWLASVDDLGDLLRGIHGAVLAGRWQLRPAAESHRRRTARRAAARPATSAAAGLSGVPGAAPADHFR